MAVLLAILAILLVAFFGVQYLADTRADIAQAQAAIEAARAAQDAAKAAQIAAAGQAGMGLGLTVIAILLAAALLAILGLVVYALYLRGQNRSLVASPAESGKRWKGGSNAYWEQIGPPKPQLTGIEQLIQLQTLEALQRLQAPQHSRALAERDEGREVW